MNIRCVNPPSPFEYDDFRAYLRAYYDSTKRARPSFSYRSFARRAGLRSPNHLQLVIQGKRNLTPPTAVAFSRAMQLDESEHIYFTSLAKFNQATTVSEREDAYQQMLSCRADSRAQRLRAEHAAYHRHWFIPTIREMLQSRFFQEDRSWIARALGASVGKRDVSKAVRILKSLGFWLDDNHVRTPLGTGPQTEGHHVHVFHREMLLKASESIEQHRAHEREIAGLTFCTNDETFEEIRKRMHSFQQELIGLIAKNEADGTRVMQLQLLCFPLTADFHEEPTP